MPHRRAISGIQSRLPQARCRGGHVDRFWERKWMVWEANQTCLRKVDIQRDLVCRVPRARFVLVGKRDEI